MAAVNYPIEVKFRIGESDKQVLDEWVGSVPEAEGNQSRALRIFLARWKKDSEKKKKKSGKGVD